MGSGGNRRRHWEVEGEGRPKQEETLGGGVGKQEETPRRVGAKH